jgi:hypothetical protein
MLPENIKWNLNKSRVIHSQFDPSFDSTQSRFLFRKVLNADVPLHTDEAYFDKRFMVKAPEEVSKEDLEKAAEKNRMKSSTEIWMDNNCIGS